MQKEPIITTEVMPDYMFRELDEKENQDFAEWADKEENQKDENLKRAGTFHPVIRSRWITFGLIVIGPRELYEPGRVK